MIDRELLLELLGEGFHAAFRKAADSYQAGRIYAEIERMTDDEWTAIIEFVADPILVELKRLDAS